MVTPPLAPHRPHPRRHHGRVTVDPYAWLSDPSDEAVLAHLRAENAYAQEVTAHLEPLRETLFEEIRARTQEADLSVPVEYRGWWYYGRTVEGGQYGIRARVPVEPGGSRPVVEPGRVPPGEQVLLDGNAEAGGSEFFALGALEVSPDGGRLAYAVDLRGDERFALRVRDLATGATRDEVAAVGYGVVWSADGRHLFYTRVDEAWRPHEVWRHEVGRPQADDVLVLAEPDERFWLGIGSSRDDRWLIVQAGSRTTSEAHLLDLADPTGPLRCVAPRRDGVEYDVEPAGDVLFVSHNTTRPDFELAWLPLTDGPETPHEPGGPRDPSDPSDPGDPGDPSDPGESRDAGDLGASVGAWGPWGPWGPWLPWLAVGEGERVVSLDAFAGHVVVTLRTGGLTALRVVPRAVGAGPEHGEPFDVPVEEELYTVALGENPSWESTRLLYTLESFLTPATVAEFDLAGGASRVLKRKPVRGGYDPAVYRQERAWARAHDGTLIPMSLVMRRDTPRDGTAPGLLYGYGAYEACLDPWFSIPRLGLLDRGVVFAVAHVRGGGELGRAWYEGGRLEHKPNTFSDTLSCAHHLIDVGLVAPDRLGLEGGSAGGLLVGATLNLDPEVFRVALAQVPFVDALNTMLDPTLPLTVIERDEWGDPLHDPAAFDLMAGYSPYENIAARPYPAILATTSLHDTRVSFAEPTKWVARLRALVPDSAGPILQRTELTAGHGGRSGRYDAWRQYAWETAFLLDQLGATALVAGARSPVTAP